MTTKILKPHSINSLENFICGWYIDKSICDLLIDYQKNSETKWEGKIAKSNGSIIIDKSVKESIDCQILDEDLRLRYFSELQICVDHYTKQYPECDSGALWRVIEPENLQHYPPGGGFKIYHCERMNGTPRVSRRYLVYMTYLNDVTDQGETEFLYQKLKIKPEKGLTLIWPVEWTHTHRGVPSPTQEKYIITGWLSLLEQEDK